MDVPDPKAEPLRLLSENPIEQVWLALSRYESVPLAMKIIVERAGRGGIQVEPELLDRKARGVAYALRSAREYLQHGQMDLTKRVLVAYYGLMNLVTALLIANPRNRYDLEEIERATKFGHGLGNTDDESAPFPVGQKVFVSPNGFVHRLLEDLGIDQKSLVIARRVAFLEMTEEERMRLLSLDDLLARVPELAEFYFHVTGRTPLCVQVFDMSVVEPAGVPVAAPNATPVHYIGLNGYGLVDANAILARLGIPLGDFAARKPAGFNQLVWSGRPQGQLPYYRSPMSPTSWLRPVLGSSNAILLHFVTLYLLSIIVRYRPALWREVTEGQLTSYFALITSYVGVTERVLPERILSQLIDRPVVTAQPGTFNAPI